jgi:hypothetical protein
LASIKRTKEDDVCSKLVREIYDWRCIETFSPNCIGGVERDTPDAQRLHASHLIGRAKYATRWLWCNQIPSCYFCHNFSEDRKYLIKDAISKHYGVDYWNLVVCLDRAYSEVRGPLALGKPFAKGSIWRDRIHKYNLQELKNLKKRRMDGEVGLILPGTEVFEDLLNDFYGDTWMEKFGE